MKRLHSFVTSPAFHVKQLSGLYGILRAKIRRLRLFTRKQASKQSKQQCSASARKGFFGLFSSG